MSDPARIVFCYSLPELIQATCDVAHLARQLKIEERFVKQDWFNMGDDRNLIKSQVSPLAKGVDDGMFCRREAIIEIDGVLHAFAAGYIACPVHCF